MRGQVGYWGSPPCGGLAIGFGREMLDWLDRQGVGRRIFASVTNERRVICLPDADGGYVMSCGANNALHYRYVSCHVPASLFLDVELPVFGLMELDFDEEEGCISTQLPDRDHELPWPKLAPDCTSYDAAQMALEALQVRMNSLVASGMTAFRPEHRMPHSLRRLIPAGAWAHCVETAKVLAGVAT